MKTKNLLITFLASAGSSLMAISSASAQSGTWNVDANGTWGTDTNWLSTVIADGSGNTANFTNDITADRTVSLDSDRTLTNVVFGDGDTATAGSWLIDNNGLSTNNLILADTTPTVTVNSLGTTKTATISAIIEGTTGLTKAGAGTLILSGANTYTGGTTISASSGTLIATTTSLSSNSLSSGAVSIGSGSTLQINNTNTINSDQTISNTFSGAGSLIVNFAAGTTGRNTRITNVTGITGTIRLANAGTTGDKWSINTAANISGASLIIDSGCQLYNAVSGTTTFGSINVTGTGNSENRGALRLQSGTLAGPVTLAGSTTIGAEGGTLSGTITSGAVGTQTLTIGTSNSNGSGTLSGAIGGGTGTIALTKVNTGTLNLSGNSSYSGVTTISNGIIAISHANALGSTEGNTIFTATGASTGPQLRLSGGINSPENITINGTTETSGFISAILNSSGNNTLSGDITLANNTNGVRFGATAGNLTFSGNISRTGTAQSLAFFASNGTNITVSNPIANGGGPLQIFNATQTTGTGTVTLSAASGSGIGQTAVWQSGILKLGVNDALNTSANLQLGATTTTAGFDVGTFDLAGFNQTVNALVGSVNTSNSSANTSRRIINSVAGTKTLTVGNGGGSGTFNGVMLTGTGDLALIKTGTGTQTLTGASTFTGGTTISDGKLIAQTNSAALGTAAVSVANSATLQLNNNLAADATLPITNAITGAGTLEITATDAPNNLPIDKNRVTVGSLSGFSGNISVLTNGMFGNFTNNNTTNQNLTIATGGFMAIAGVAGDPHNYGFGKLDGAGTIIRNAGGISTSTLTLGNGDATGGIFSGAIEGASTGTNSGRFSSSGLISVIKVGTGTQTLSGSNTYAGATTITGGTLVITGATQGTSAINVNAGGTLGLDIASPVTASSAAVALTGSVLVSGTPTLASYTLLTASSITGTPTLATPVPGYALVVEGGNTLKLIAAGGSAYDTWEAANAPGSNPQDDTDGDGVPNALEFVLGGTSATKDANKLPVIATSGANMTFTFQRAVSSIDPKTVVTIETSTDLVTWNTAPSPYTVPDTAVANSPGVTVVEDTSVGFDTITLIVPQAPDTKKFARLKVSITP